jgi:hypothetical protein
MSETFATKDKKALAANSLAQDKRSLGSFYTIGNPFVLEGFREWMEQVSPTTKYLEPFAGSGQIKKLMKEAGYKRSWRLFDADLSVKGVSHQDTIKNFPKGFSVVVTNPPYLSFHFAKRKGLAVSKEYFQGYSSLYLTAAAAALAESDYIAMIIPESFATTGLLTQRLQHIISLPMDMFNDTEMPTCLALWGPKITTDFKVWRCSKFLGNASQLRKPLATPLCANRVEFNRMDGQIGLKAIDGTTGPGIAFGSANIIPDSKVKVSGRLLSRVLIQGLDPLNAADVWRDANTRLDQWRKETIDFPLTAFKGVRDDGVFRRRLDFTNARALLSQSLCKFEDHHHGVAV